MLLGGQRVAAGEARGRGLRLRPARLDSGLAQRARRVAAGRYARARERRARRHRRRRGHGGPRLRPYARRGRARTARARALRHDRRPGPDGCRRRVPARPRLPGAARSPTPRRGRRSTTTGSTSGRSSAARSSASDGRFRRLADPRHAPVRSLRALAGGVVGVRDGAAVLRLLRGRGDETTTAEALRRAGVSRATVETLLRPVPARHLPRGAPRRRRAGSSTSSCGVRRRTGSAAVPAAWAPIAAQLARGARDPHAAPPSRRSGPDAVSLESGEQLRARAVVVATAGIVDEPAHGWNGVTCVYYDAAASRRFPGPGSSSTARAARSTTSASRARSLRAMRRRAARSSP